MSHDAGDGHIQRLGDVHQRLAVLEDRRHELVHQLAVRTAVSAGLDAGRQRGTGQRWQVLFLSFVFSIERASLSADAAHFAAGSRRVPADGHPRHAAFAGAKQGDFRAEGVAVAVVLRLQPFRQAGDAQTRDVGKAAGGHTHVVGVGMRRIPLRRSADPPALVRVDRFGRVVVVLAFGVHQLAEPAGLVDLPHRVQVLVEIRGLEHHVRPAAGLDRLEQLIGFLERAERRRDGARDVLAVLQHLDAMPGVTGRIGGDKHGFDLVVFDQFFERGIGLLTAACLGQGGAAVGEQVADSHDFHVGMVLETERGPELAHAEADDADTQLAVGHGLPALGGPGVGRRRLEALNHRLGRRGRPVQAEHRGPNTQSLQERTP